MAGLPSARQRFTVRRAMVPSGRPNASAVVGVEGDEVGAQHVDPGLVAERLEQVGVVEGLVEAGHQVERGGVDDGLAAPAPQHQPLGLQPGQHLTEVGSAHPELVGEGGLRRAARRRAAAASWSTSSSRLSRSSVSIAMVRTAWQASRSRPRTSPVRAVSEPAPATRSVARWPTRTGSAGTSATLRDRRRRRSRRRAARGVRRPRPAGSRRRAPRSTWPAARGAASVWLARRGLEVARPRRVPGGGRSGPRAGREEGVARPLPLRRWPTSTTASRPAPPSTSCSATSSTTGASTTPSSTASGPGAVLALAVLSEVGAAPGRFRAAPGELVDRFGRRPGLTVLETAEADGVARLLARRP